MDLREERSARLSSAAAISAWFLADAVPIQSK